MSRTATTRALLLVTAGLPACATGPKPIFPPVSPTLVWPRPPDRPRIRYVGELSGESSLKRGRTAIEALREVIGGPLPTVEFSTPTAVAVSGDRVYVSDAQRAGVHVMDLEQRTHTLVQQAGGERFGWPIDVTVAGGRIVVADSERACVDLFSADGRYERTLGRDTLERPASVAWVPGADELWVLDAGAHACVAFDLQGGRLRSVGARGAGPRNFNYPAGIAYRAPFGFAIADAMNFRVQLLDPAGNLLAAFGQKGDAAGDFALPRDVAYDSDGHVYVLDSQFENVQIFDRQGRLLMAFGREGRGPGEFYLPSGITIDARDRVWIADTYNRRVQVFQYLAETGSETQTDATGQLQ